MLEDFLKKKKGFEEVREEEREKEAGGAFKKSRKTHRSPEGNMKEVGEGKLEGMMKEMMKKTRMMWGRVEESLGGIRREIEEIRIKEEEWKVERERLEERITILERKFEGSDKGRDRSELEGLEKRMRMLEVGVKGSLERMGTGLIRRMEGRIEEMEKRMERTDREEKKNNIVVKGIKFDKGKEIEQIEKVLKDIAGDVKVGKVS
ncbi:non-muscle caldesmon-like [Odontomachus brunneus]|uniref:non-muscle caldesmon-like n=1 Tax=Odontomachus brunneus TaxID=486640 RepID=UPI0013F24AB1|nr:non-muscle caldesmon-like [Odontomachus brunneus]